MSIKIEYHRHFIKAYHKLSTKVQKAVDDSIRIFAIDPFCPKLGNHVLSGKYQGYRSINITGDYRAVYTNLSKEKVIFVMIGTHAQLYG